MICRLLIVLGLSASTLSPSVVQAQDFSKVFKEIDRIAISGRLGGFVEGRDVLESSNKDSWNRFGHSGIGIELGYNITEPTKDRAYFFEGGLGYSQLGGFRLSQTDIDLRGTVRELPAISLYVISNNRIGRSRLGFYPYGGISSGFIRLQNTVVIDANGNQSNLSSDAFSIGGSIGAAFGDRTLSPFVELGYKVRDFQSIEYKQGSTTVLPASWPRKLNFSGWQLEFGMQVDLANLKAKP